MKNEKLIFLGWNAYGDFLSYNGLIRFMLKYYDIVYIKTDNKFIKHLTDLYNDVLDRVHFLTIDETINVINNNKGISVLNSLQYVDFDENGITSKVSSDQFGNLNIRSLVDNDFYFNGDNKISDFFGDEERKKRLKVKTLFKMFYESAVTFNYSKIEYDMVLTSPPYYFLEKYSNNVIYSSKTEMKDKFYIPVITNSFNHLKEHGYYCLNVNEQIYEDICVKILGNAHQKISLKKSKRQNEYSEYIYIWKKGYKITEIF